MEHHQKVLVHHSHPPISFYIKLQVYKHCKALQTCQLLYLFSFCPKFKVFAVEALYTLNIVQMKIVHVENDVGNKCIVTMLPFICQVCLKPGRYSILFITILKLLLTCIPTVSEYSFLIPRLYNFQHFGGRDVKIYRN